MKKSFLFCFISLFISVNTYSQKENAHIRAGNKEFKKQNFADAEVEYQNAIEINPSSFHATFNYADALYMNEQYEEAITNYKILLNQETDKQRLGNVHHNIGNSYMQLKQLDPAIEAYKNALRVNPSDMETKYNLAYALDQKSKQDQQNQCQNENQDQQQDQQDKEQDKDNQEQNEKDKENDEQNDEQQEQQSQSDENNSEKDDEQKKNNQPSDQQKDEISKEDAERILKAFDQDDKNTQQKAAEKIKSESRKINVEKDW